MSDQDLTTEQVIKILDIEHAGCAPDGENVVAKMKSHDGDLPAFAMPAPIAEKLIYALQIALASAADKRIGRPATIRGPILEVSSIAARVAPDGSHAILTFEASSAQPLNIRLKPRDLGRMRQELKRIEEQLRRLRAKH